MVDTLGLLLMVKVVAADVQERDGAKQLLTTMNEERFESREAIKPRPSQLDPYVPLSRHTAPDILSLRFCLC